MLNRRFLRIKALQAVFAYQVKKEANVFRSNDFIEESFAPDLTAAKRPDYEGLTKSTQKAKELFAKCYQTRKLEEGVDKEIARVVENAFNFYNAKNRESAKEVKEQMLGDTDMILKSYYHILASFVQLADLVERNYKARESKSSSLVNTLELNIVNNKFINLLRNDHDYEYSLAKYDATWQTEDEQIFLKDVYKEILLEDETWSAYQSQKEPTLEQDCDIILHLIKKIFFKKELILSHYEEKDINWEENQAIVKSLCVKTVKKVLQDDSFMFFDLALNWEEDKEYFIDLFNAGIAEKKEIQTALNKRLENWDTDRVALTDKIILHLALNEMMMYSSIPVKVTINEFIEVAKRYSTPKSKVFVNGILDKASKDLQSQGFIKKSGRGLLDNK